MQIELLSNVESKKVSCSDAVIGQVLEVIHRASGTKYIVMVGDLEVLYIWGKGSLYMNRKTSFTDEKYIIVQVFPEGTKFTLTV